LASRRLNINAICLMRWYNTVLTLLPVRIGKISIDIVKEKFILWPPVWTKT